MDEAVRIRYVLLHAYGRGGTIATTLSMASALAERGHDVEVASLLQGRGRPAVPGVHSSPARSAHRTTTSPRPPGSPGNAVRWATRAALGRTTSSLAHPHDARCTELTRAHDLWLRHYLGPRTTASSSGTRITLNLALARLRADRQVTVAQEHNHLAANPAIRADYVEALPTARRLAVLTEKDAAAYRTLLGDGVPVAVVPNALPHGTRLRRAPLEAKVAVAAGSLIARKGFDLLIDAWRPVAARHPDWRLRIHGEGPSEQSSPSGSSGPN